MPNRLLPIIGMIAIATTCYCQPVAAPSDSLPSLSSKAIEKVYGSADREKKRLDKQSTKILQRFTRQQQRIAAKLYTTDSASAITFLQSSQSAFAQFEQKLSAASFDQYIPRLDSLSTSLKFLEANPAWTSTIKDGKEKLENAMSRVKGIENSLQQGEAIKKFIRERRQYLKAQLEQLGMVKELKKLNKEIYYYSQQLKEYREALQDPKKAEKKLLEIVSKTKFFQDFLKKNSLFASLFRMPEPGDPNYASNLAGLQTRAQVNHLIQSQLAVGGPNGSQMLQQNVQQAQSQLRQLKDKLLGSGGTSSDDEIPNFKPNRQKTKSFWKRLEHSTNVQSQKASNFFPVTSDIGLSLGYKLDNQSVIGFGASYKLGWGRGWRNIRITNEGLGFRSFVDIHWKKALWISGGYEQNYRTAFRDFSQLKDLNAWQQSGLIGISKSISVKSKFFKKTKLQLLWDFLSYREVPRTQPVLLRIGYIF